MADSQPGPFRDVSFPDLHPQQSVADHEVLMSFLGDAEAIAFREWWFERGSVLFHRWLIKVRGD